MSNNRSIKRGLRARQLAFGDYDVGYGKPPKDGQFKKGRSGRRAPHNPTNDNLITAFRRYVMEKVRIREGDVVRMMTRGEAVIYANYHRALQKDARAMHNMFLVAEENGLFLDENDPTQVGGRLLVPSKYKSEEDFDRFWNLVHVVRGEEDDLKELQKQLEPGNGAKNHDPGATSGSGN